MSSFGASSPPPLPFLPGYHVELNPKERYHKTHLFDVSNGIRVDMNKEKLENRAAVSNLHPLSITSSPPPASSAAASLASPPMGRLPAWVAYDRHVLRFTGYFKEAIHASAIENWRIRKCLIYFYLEDESIHIAEPKVENSGIPQGVFVKRHRIPKPNSNLYFSVADFRLGAELLIYGRLFRVCSCDEFTRSFYSQNQLELGVEEQMPIDPFMKKQTAPIHTHHKLMNSLKEFMEASLGKPMHNGIEATQKFLKHDGKVLRFYAQWDDDKMYGEKRPYIIHYFLADDSVEVQEVAVPNSGRDPFPSLLKRQKLPKNFAEIGMDCSRIGQADDGAVQYYSHEDFRVGSFIQVYGRKLFICGADAFTVQWYIDNYGMSASDFPRLNMRDEPDNNFKIEPPPHNGFGSEEDSLASFLYLMPKVPKADFKKLIELDGVNLRFLAKFLHPTKVDRDRRFIVTFYLANDTLQVFEKFERNSGFIGGKFLERDRVKNPDTGDFICASDLGVGRILKINKYEFEIVDTDEYTKKFMENNPQIWNASQHLQGQGNLENTGSPRRQ